MARPTSSVPTDGELAILRVLWERGSGTVRQIHEQLLRQGRPAGYTSVLKILQIMTEKGLVVRDESQRTHLYRAARSEAQTQRKLVRNLLDRAFGGSAHKLVLHALAAAKTSPKEMAEIRKLLEPQKGE